tara:strand:+ start:1841 stop:2032 length:192 start_codon:yes stop_codon:yes gene_type:complete
MPRTHLTPDKKSFIKIQSATPYHHDLIDNFQDCLDQVGIDCFNDIEMAKKKKCDLFIRIERRD